MTRQQKRKLYRQIDAIYARVPEVPCQRRCGHGCGPIMMTPPEWDRIEERRGAPIPPYGPIENYCPLLTDSGECSVYPVRPLICRIWGVTRRLQCPHGCQPSRWLTDEEIHRLLHDLWAVTGMAARWIAPDDWPYAEAMARGITEGLEARARGLIDDGLRPPSDATKEE